MTPAGRWCAPRCPSLRACQPRDTRPAVALSSMAGVHVCSGVFYSCAKEASHQEPLLEKKFGIKV